MPQPAIIKYFRELARPHGANSQRGSRWSQYLTLLCLCSPH